MNLETRIRSTAMRSFSSTGFQRLMQSKARLARQIRQQAPAVHYFHQVDDPYSHLAIQKLDQLRAAYDLPFIPHLVSKPDTAFQGSSEHFDQWALRDAVTVAVAFGTSFPQNPHTPDPAAVVAANSVLAPSLEQPDFAENAQTIGEALWTGQLADKSDSQQQGQRAVDEGNTLRKKLGHFLGGMFYFDGEWYWGIDRIRLLEQRLIEEGRAWQDGSLCVPEPTPANTAGLHAGQILLEYFPSLRSPYTAVGHQRVLDLIATSGVDLRLRPVMPMLMRGVPAPRAKQRYIITDAGREGRAHGAPLGRIVDPFGEPVKRAFALFAAAQTLDEETLDKGMDFVTAYLSAAWVEGIDITTQEGLRRVAVNANIDWKQLQKARQGTDWEALLDENLQEMLTAGLWGVPSFRISGGSDPTPFACWGQDRIWRVANEIARRTRNK